MENSPLTCISILNWMNYTDTIHCIHSVLKLDYPNFHIIVRDNASPNDSFSILKKEFPDLQIECSSQNNGFASGHYKNYLMAKKKKADLFWILNADLVVDTLALTELVNAYKKLGNTIYGSVSLNPNDQKLIDFGGAEYGPNSNEKLTYNTWKNKAYSNLLKTHLDFYEVESVEGSSMLIPMDVIEQFGFMKLDFFMYGEETDYCYRLRKSGIKSFVIIPSLVHHYNEGSTNLSPKLKIITIYYRRRNALRFSMEHLKMTRWEALSYQNGAVQNLKTVLKGFFSKNKEMYYFYALACLHAFLGKKGKIIQPEKLLN